jgi:hypothetical protein
MSDNTQRSTSSEEGQLWYFMRGVRASVLVTAAGEHWQASCQWHEEGGFGDGGEKRSDVVGAELGLALG